MGQNKDEWAGNRTGKGESPCFSKSTPYACGKSSRTTGMDPISRPKPAAKNSNQPITLTILLSLL